MDCDKSHTQYIIIIGSLGYSTISTGLSNKYKLWYLLEIGWSLIKKLAFKRHWVTVFSDWEGVTELKFLCFYLVVKSATKLISRNSFHSRDDQVPRMEVLIPPKYLPLLVCPTLTDNKLLLEKRNTLSSPSLILCPVPLNLTNSSKKISYSQMNYVYYVDTLHLATLP